MAKSLLQKVQQRLNVSRIAEIESVCGLAHGFDLTWLLAKAVRQAGRVDRPSVRTEMEKLGPFQGAVRNYDRPFTPNRQDALDETDTFFARYIRGNGLVPVDG